MSSQSRRVLFVSGTRADYSKLKPLISAAKSCSPSLDVGIFVTGMHMLSEYGSTHLEVAKVGEWDYRYINQSDGDSPTSILAKTVTGLSDFIREVKPDLLVVHGDRIEALAAAIVGAMTNTLVAHVEGGELSGTIDDSYRHAITKLSQVHLVSNEEARRRLHSLGEDPESTWAIGSPELDLMHSQDLPSLAEVQKRYDIPWDEYAIAILHPVATESHLAAKQAEIFADALKKSGKNYVVIESNNDLGSSSIRDVIRPLTFERNIRVLPSMRFEHFLSLLRQAQFIIGNSSSGVREAPHYGVPAINVGSRQNGRVNSKMVIDCEFESSELDRAIDRAMQIERLAEHNFGDGKSAERFKSILESGAIWNTSIQKVFYEGDLK